MNKVEYLGLITQKQLRTNEIVRSGILRSTSLTTVKNLLMSIRVSVLFLSGSLVHQTAVSPHESVGSRYETYTGTSNQERTLNLLCGSVMLVYVLLEPVHVHVGNMVVHRHQIDTVTL